MRNAQVVDIDDTDHNETTIVTFYSYAGGAGRSCTVANIALILANQGSRVLVADLDLRSPSIYRYLQVFFPGSVEPPAPLPVKLSCTFAAETGSVDFFGPTTDVVTNPESFVVGREQLLGMGYDYVLIDGPSGVSAQVDSVTEVLPDVLVVAYNLSQQAIDGAAQRAHAVLARPRGHRIRVLPVPMRVDVRAHGLTARMRTTARQQLSWLLDDLDGPESRRYWDDVEIPYEPDYSLEEGLPILDDPSDQRNSLLDAYRRLTAIITRGQVGTTVADAPMPDAARAIYRASRSRSLAEQTTTVVLHSAPDRAWAEWIGAELERMNIAATRQRLSQLGAENIPQSGSIVIVLSAFLGGVPYLDDCLNAIANGVAAGRLTVLTVGVDGSQLPARISEVGFIDLTGLSWDDARTALMSYYWSTAGPTADAGDAQFRYPGTISVWPPAVLWKMPRRNLNFVGREDPLDEIRDHFTSAAASRPYVLTGPPGVGKSELAAEYAYRFASQYHLVWLLRSESQQSVQSELTELAATMKVPGSGDAPSAVISYLEAENRLEKNWLLIYDGVDHPADLIGFLPTADQGHVLVTSRRAAAEFGDHAEVTAFEPVVADDLLAGTVPHITQFDATRVAVIMKGLPLAIRLAGAWIRVVAETLREVGVPAITATASAVEEFVEQFAAGADPAIAVATGRNPLDIVVNLLVELLARDDWGVAALYLLDTCVHLSSRGMSQRLLRSAEMLIQLEDADDRISDPVTLHNVLRSLARYGFLSPDQPSEAPVQVHPLILDVLRARLTADQLANRRATVVRILAACAPADIFDDTRAHADIYRELQLHLQAADADRSTEQPVRRWLVNQVRFLWQTDTVSAWITAAELGERLVSYWTTAVPASEDDPLLLRLQTQLANVYRSRGEFRRAYELDAQTLARQRRVLGLRHLRTLMTARSYAADLRQLGDFEGSFLEDYSTWQAFAHALGEDDALTIIAASNLGVSQLLIGEAEQALQRATADYDRTRNLATEWPDQLAWAAYHAGTFLRELGRYQESLDELKVAHDSFERLVIEGKVAASAPVLLRTKAGLAATSRRLGQPIPDFTKEALATSHDMYGDRHPDTLAFALSFAGDLHAEGKSEAAVRQAGKALDGCTDVFGGSHPFTHICQVNISIYALAAGDDEKADAMSISGWTSLSRALGNRHPWRLAATLARANVLATTGKLEEAKQLDENAVSGYQLMGINHPFTRIAESNAGNTRLRVIANSEPHLRGVTEAQTRQCIELDIPPT